MDETRRILDEDDDLCTLRLVAHKQLHELTNQKILLQPKSHLKLCPMKSENGWPPHSHDKQCPRNAQNQTFDRSSMSSRLEYFLKSEWQLMNRWIVCWLHWLAFVTWFDWWWNKHNLTRQLLYTQPWYHLLLHEICRMFRRSQTLLAPIPKEYHDALSQIDSWAFDCFALNELTLGHALVGVMTAMSSTCSTCRNMLASRCSIATASWNASRLVMSTWKRSYYVSVADQSSKSGQHVVSTGSRLQ